MNFDIKREEFLKGLTTVQNAISQKTTLPILSNLLLEAGKTTIKIAATDLEVGVVTKVDGAIKEQGAITVQAKKLIDLIKELPQDDISLLLKKNEMLNIDSGKAHFKIKGMPKEDFPEIPEIKDKDSISIQQAVLSEMINLVIFAVSKDETRTALNGVLFVLKKDKIELVATDGRRLAVATKNITSKVNDEKKVIIPTKAVQEVARMLKKDGEIKISFGQNQVFFDFGDTKILSALIEGDFPNYEKVIPKEKEEKVKVKRTDFLEAAKRAKLFTSPDSLAIKLDISKNKMTVSKRAEYLGEASEDIQVVYNGKNIAIGFNPDYIIDVLKAVPEEEVGFEIEDSDRPGAIRKGNDYVYVVLPMQVA